MSSSPGGSNISIEEIGPEDIEDTPPPAGEVAEVLNTGEPAAAAGDSATGESVEDPPLDTLAAADGPSDAADQPDPVIEVSAPSVPTLPIVPVVSTVQDDEEEDDDDIDETIAERLIGLTEMFPDSVRKGAVSLVSGSFGMTKAAFSLSKSVAWCVFSTATVLFLPIMIETERLSIQDQQKSQKNQILLGTGTAHSGAPPLGQVPV